MLVVSNAGSNHAVQSGRSEHTRINGNTNTPTPDVQRDSSEPSSSNLIAILEQSYHTPPLEILSNKEIELHALTSQVAIFGVLQHASATGTTGDELGIAHVRTFLSQLTRQCSDHVRVAEITKILKQRLQEKCDRAKAQIESLGQPPASITPSDVRSITTPAPPPAEGATPGLIMKTYGVHGKNKSPGSMYDPLRIEDDQQAGTSDSDESSELGELESGVIEINEEEHRELGLPFPCALTTISKDDLLRARKKIRKRKALAAKEVDVPRRRLPWQNMSDQDLTAQEVGDQPSRTTQDTPRVQNAQAHDSSLDVQEPNGTDEADLGATNPIERDIDSNIEALFRSPVPTPHPDSSTAIPWQPNSGGPTFFEYIKPMKTPFNIFARAAHDVQRFARRTKKYAVHNYHSFIRTIWRDVPERHKAAWKKLALRRVTLPPVELSIEWQRLLEEQGLLHHFLPQIDHSLR